jgi:uncharacterized paraquat-inducible protein A
MSNDFVYTPSYIPCPVCGYMIPYDQISMDNMYVCPSCHQQISAGITKLANASTVEG